VGAHARGQRFTRIRLRGAGGGSGEEIGHGQGIAKNTPVPALVLIFWLRA
jgi:hypothetical protein